MSSVLTMGWGFRLNTLLEKATGRRMMKPPGRHPSQFGRVDLVSAYGALAELRRRRTDSIDPSAPIDLRLAELKVFSQNGEDGIIDELVRHLGIDDRYFVEFGVQDGIECNTRVLAEVMGWSGLYFEPSPDDHEALARRWAGSDAITVVNDAVSPAHIDEQFRRHGVPEQFGLLSIDVDGQDYWIWEALPDRYQPAIVIVECNSSFPRGSAIVEARGLPWTKQYSDTFGASIEALRQLGERRGYVLVHVDLTGINTFFVRADLLEGRQVRGVTTRGANYGLEGVRHPPTPVRPTVTP